MLNKNAGLLLSTSTPELSVVQGSLIYALALC